MWLCEVENGSLLCGTMANMDSGQAGVGHYHVLMPLAGPRAEGEGKCGVLLNHRHRSDHVYTSIFLSAFRSSE